MLEINDDIRIPLAEIRFTYVRSSGPGGQNVNKVASKAVMRWTPGDDSTIPVSAMERFRKLFPRCVTGEGEIVLSSQRTRDALKNKEDCLNKLRDMLHQVLQEPKRRIKTKPTRGSVLRRLENKARQAKKKRERQRPDF